MKDEKNRTETFFSTLYLRVLLSSALTFYKFQTYLSSLYILATIAILYIVDVAKSKFGFGQFAHHDNPQKSPDNIESIEFISHKNEITDHVLSHLPNYFLSGIGSFPKFLHATTLVPWVLWRRLHLSKGDQIDKTCDDGIEVHIEIFWATGAEKDASPALFVVPDLIFLSRFNSLYVDHYVQILQRSIERKCSNQNLCVMRVDKYDSTLLPDDVKYLDAAVSLFNNLLADRIDRERRQNSGIDFSSKFMFDHNSATTPKSNAAVAPTSTETRKTRHKNIIAAVGYSSGGVLLSKYLAKYNRSQPFSGAVILSSFFDAKQHFNKIIRKQKNLFRPFMVWSLKIKLLHNWKHFKRKNIDAADNRFLTNLLSAASFANNPREVFNVLIESRNEVEGRDEPIMFDDFERFSSVKDLDNVMIPLLSINALDDPFVSLIPTQISTTNPFVMFGLTRRGGHCGWLTSRSRSWASDTVINFSSAIQKAHNDEMLLNHMHNLEVSVKMERGISTSPLANKGSLGGNVSAVKKVGGAIYS